MSEHALPEEGTRRAILERLAPEIDCGRFPVKRTIGERVDVEVDLFTDGHDRVSGVLLHRHESEQEWTETPLQPLVNDRWRASFTVTRLGHYLYTVQGWVNPLATWRHNLRRKVEAGLNVAPELLAGAALLEAAAAEVPDRKADLRLRARDLAGDALDADAKVELALGKELEDLVGHRPGRRRATAWPRELEVVVDTTRARFSTWYELFPRSAAPTPDRHGTLRDVEARLPAVAEMGFDVLYLPPIHPVGRSHRKGRNNAATAQPADVGSPWAIGAAEGGHTAVHPDLGTLADLERLTAHARELGIEVALDIAWQCSPDHPYVKEHPEWFRKRPDGSIQYAENPPKKYEDIYPFDFECEAWADLWRELRDVVLFWVEKGVRIFRVDNPHTKPFAFWEWLIDQVKTRHPEVVFLSEAFTRPKVMYRLAKLGFSQSYTYFAWRNTRWELTEYFTELTQSEVREFFRPNLWPNTPDILTEYLQTGGRPAFMARLVLAATLGASYGIYGPAFELCVNAPREPGSEEYLDSEKYEVRYWDRDAPHSLKDFIARVNRARHDNPSLQFDGGLRFHSVDNEQLIAYSKRTEDGDNVTLMVVNLDPHHTHSGWVELDLEALGLDAAQPFQVHDLLSDARYLWQGPRNYVELNPDVAPAHLFRIRRRVRTEKDFSYYM